MDDFYDLLEVPEDASQADIKRAWRGKAQEYHPDVNDDDRAAVQFKTLQKAYDVLSDETERSAYDRMGHANYVSKRLDGLPTAGMTRPGEQSSGKSRWGSGSSRSRSSSSGGTASGSSTRTSSRSRSSSSGSSSSSSSARSSSSRTASSGSSRGSSSRSRGSSSSSRGSSSRNRSSGSSGRSSRNRSSRSSRGRGSSNGSASNRTSGRSSRSRSGGSGSAGRGSGESSASTDAAAGAADATPRNPLWYGWTAILVAGVAYLGGLAAYLDANAAAIATFASALGTDPQAALLTGNGLLAPGTFTLGAVAAPGSALAFPATAALLGVVFLAVVGKFGHGTAYLYLLGALAPLASLALGPVVSVSAAGLTLALVVVAPTLATTLFLADVGRYLLTDR